MRARLAVARYGASLAELAMNAEDLLGESERAYLMRIQRPQRRAQFFRGRELLRYLLIDCDATADVDDDGRPRIRSTTSLHASIAHSGDAVAAVVAACPVGVDIEPARKWRDPAAIEALLDTGGGQSAALRAWVVAEARLKAGGTAGPSTWRASWNDCEVALMGVQDPPLTVFFDVATATYNPLELQWQMVQPSDRLPVVDGDDGR